MMAERERANQNELSEAALRRGVAPGAAETFIDFGNKALRTFDAAIERKRLKKEAEALKAEDKARIAQEKKDKQQQWLLGQRFETQRAYGVPIPELGVEGEKRFAPRAPNMYYDPVTGMLINRGTGTAKQVTEGRPDTKDSDYRRAVEKLNRLQKDAANEARTYTKTGGGTFSRVQYYKNGKKVEPFDANKYINDRMTPEEKALVGQQKIKKPTPDFNSMLDARYKDVTDSSSNTGTTTVIRQ